MHDSHLEEVMQKGALQRLRIGGARIALLQCCLANALQAAGDAGACECSPLRIRFGQIRDLKVHLLRKHCLD